MRAYVCVFVFACVRTASAWSHRHIGCGRVYCLRGRRQVHVSCNARSDYIRTDSTDICADHAWADGIEHTDVRRLV